MLQLDGGNAMSFLVDSLETLGFSWAYRVVDTRAFGLPQRRKRVLLLASRTEDPRPVLFGEDAGPRPEPSDQDVACGFYWTEGTRGLGWAVDAVPTLKGGSGLGIPSPPAIRLPRGGGIVTPDIRDAERLQGFPANWTRSDTNEGRRGEGARWKMVGNAVSVPVAEWIGRRFAGTRSPAELEQVELSSGTWPAAAWGMSGHRCHVRISTWPVRRRYKHLEDFLRYETRPLSERASAGFLTRAEASRLNFPTGFLDEVRAHHTRLRHAA
jgi:DNA (cytosine-5)-methyltransferase 1